MGAAARPRLRLAWGMLLPLLLALQAQAATPIAGAERLLVVTTAGWDSAPGTLRRFERGADGAWLPVGDSIRVVVGEHGLGWGVGLHPSDAGAGPVKHEGDGRAPAGVFRLSTAFGYAPEDSAAWVPLEYHRATPTYECVDDAGSRYYNQTLERGTVFPDWSSSEIMRRRDVLYRWGVIVAHNMPATPGRGSCIFLHIWSGPDDSGTAGCTAMAEPALLEVMRWLDPRKHPLLVQLTRGEYSRLREAWQLP